FLERGVLLGQLRDVARKLALRSAIDLRLPLALVERAAHDLEILLERAILGRERRELLARLFAIETGDPIAVLDEPPDDARHRQHHENVEEPAPMPRHLRADRHPRGADSEVAAQAPRDASHGMTAIWSMACV